MIIAKPVIEDQYWILTKADKKIGVVERDKKGVKIRIHNATQHFNTVPTLKKNVNISFEPIKTTKQCPTNMVYGFDVGCRAHNAIWDVKHRLPLFNRDTKSKSWYAAGWYVIQQGKKHKIERNPKFIILQRYPFQGPFHTREEAHDQSIR